MQDLQVAGIQFDLILIRLGRGIAAEHVEAQTKSAAMQIHLRSLDPHPPQQPVIAVSVTHDTTTTMSHELRMVNSDAALKSGSVDDVVQTIKITGIGGDYV